MGFGTSDTAAAKVVSGLSPGLLPLGKGESSPGDNGKIGEAVFNLAFASNFVVSLAPYLLYSEGIYQGAQGAS